MKTFLLRKGHITVCGRFKLNDMHILVNTRLLLPGRFTGVEWFTFETLRRLVKWHPDVKFSFLFDRPYHQDFVFGDNVQPIVAPPQSRHPFLWYLWFEYSVPKVIEATKPDLFLSPDGFISLKATIPQISVIHDLNFVHQPEGLPWLTGWYYRYFFEKFAEKATRIATVSHYSANDIATTYNFDTNRIDVIGNGVGDDFFPTKEIPDLPELDSKPYFLFVGSLNPRKNILGMLKSFELFKLKYNLPHKLVIVGDPMFKLSEMQSFYSAMQFKSDVIFAGRREGSDLNKLYAHATALWFVSFFEGFGIPIIEAFRAGCPVLTSTTTSMPEVAGNAAILQEPENIEGIARDMYNLATDTLMVDQLKSKAKLRAQYYTWDKAAERLWDSINKSL